MALFSQGDLSGELESSQLLPSARSFCSGSVAILSRFFSLLLIVITAFKTRPPLREPGGRAAEVFITRPALAGEVISASEVLSQGNGSMRSHLPRRLLLRPPSPVCLGGEAGRQQLGLKGPWSERTELLPGATACLGPCLRPYIRHSFPRRCPKWGPHIVGFINGFINARGD